MQYKNKENLFKVLFIVILLGFIISLVGCSWLSFGLLNILDPQAQIRVKDVKYVEGTNKTEIDISLFTLNEVEFNGSGIEFEYFNGSNKLTSLNRVTGVNFYISADSSLDKPTTITKLKLYYPSVLDYVKTNLAFNKVTCNLYILGKDGAGHNLKIKVASGLLALGEDEIDPIAKINIEPKTQDCGKPVEFDGSDSNDGEGIGITKYEWYIPKIQTAALSTSISFPYTFSCSLITDSEEVITVKLKVTDYHGNEDTAADTVTITNPDASSGGGCL